MWSHARRLRESAEKQLQQASEAPRAPDARKRGPPKAANHYLLRAFQRLWACNSSTDFAERHRLSVLTQDEEALHALEQRSREFVPALAELRTQAIDSEVFRELVAGAGSDPQESDGAVTEHEFAVSGGESGAESPKEEPLVLPPGWRCERILLKGRRLREFVSPAGVRYRTEAQAKQAVARERRSANLASTVLARLSSRLNVPSAAAPGARAGGPEEPAPAASLADALRTHVADRRQHYFDEPPQKLARVS